MDMKRMNKYESAYHSAKAYTFDPCKLDEEQRIDDLAKKYTRYMISQLNSKRRCNGSVSKGQFLDKVEGLIRDCDN